MLRLVGISFLCFVCVLSPLLKDESFAQRTSKPRVGLLSDSAPSQGCGCYFGPRRAKGSLAGHVFVEGIEHEEGSWMNIDGKDVKLQEVSIAKKNSEERVGDIWKRSFTAENISVTATLVTTRVCARNDEDCESHDYRATFKVRKGKYVETVTAFGSCGC